MKKLILIYIFLTFISCQQLSFQTTMLSYLFNNPSQNICISPLSIYQVVSLISNGATGKTQNEILKALIPDSNINTKTQFKLNQNNNRIINLYGSNNKHVKIANAVMTKRNLLSSFLKYCKKYDAFVEPLKSTEQVNKWCSEKTNGKINNIIENINNVEMILLNAVYFKSDWANKFKFKNTKMRDFTNSNNEIVKVKTMYQEFNSINYYEDEKLQMIELPYEDNQLSMIIILPNKKNYNSIYNFLNNEKKNDYTKLLKRLKKTSKVKLYLPKFKFEYKSSLKEVFKKMGMEKAFSDYAEFTQLNEGPKLKIDKIIHKTFISVDEEGTEAAAVTAIINVRTSSRPKKTINMIVDHSFAFMIKDNRVRDTNGNNLMLFYGVVNNLK